MDERWRREVKLRRRKRYRRRRMVRAFSGILFMVFFAAAVLFVIEKGKNFRETTDELAEDRLVMKEPARVSRNVVDLEHLHSQCAILVNLETGETIGEHNSQDKIYPASMTKIMTAILAVEHTKDLGESVTLPREMFEALYTDQASLAGFLPGELVRLKDLLYGILLPSGAECSIAFADRISGSESQFADLMNEKAKELGMNHSHFCNSTGLHDPEHYSTVADMAILLRYALKDETFRDALTCSRYSTAASNLHPHGITFRSTMFNSMESNVVTGGEILGGKTGYTQEAGLCLASLAEVNGKEYILVTAKADGTHQTEPYHILDAIDVYSRLGESGE